SHAPRCDGVFKGRQLVEDTFKPSLFSSCCCLLRGGQLDGLVRQFADSVRKVAYAGAGFLCILAHVGEHFGIDIIDKCHLGGSVSPNLLQCCLVLRCNCATEVRKLRPDAVSQPLKAKEPEHVAAEASYPLKKASDSAADSIERVRNGELDILAHLAEEAAYSDSYRVQPAHQGDTKLLDDLELFA